MREDIFVDPAAWEEIRALKDSDGWMEGVEARWMRCDGDQATVRLSGRWVKRDNNEPVCELIVEDITARNCFHSLRLHLYDRLPGAKSGCAVCVSCGFSVLSYF